jgi:hypothetical protein
MENKKLPMYKKMFNHANGLNKGFILLSENIFEGKKDGDYIGPSVLCSTLCIEILLKCLQLVKYEDIFTEDDLKNKCIKVNEHKYSEIFKRIDDDIKMLVIKTYNSKYNENIGIEDYKNKLIQVGDDNFIDWRYVYEKDARNLDMQLQFRLLDSLGETAIQIIKSKSNS